MYTLRENDWKLKNSKIKLDLDIIKINLYPKLHFNMCILCKENVWELQIRPHKIIIQIPNLICQKYMGRWADFIYRKVACITHFFPAKILLKVGGAYCTQKFIFTSFFQAVILNTTGVATADIVCYASCMSVY